MKKIDKINILKDLIDTPQIGKCTFTHGSYDEYYYVLDISDTLFLGIEEDDFSLDGFHVRKISTLKNIEARDDICSKINEELNLRANIRKPQIDISSWKSLFESLKKLNIFISVENDDHDNFMYYLGIITEVKASYIVMSTFDADGVWYNETKIAYSDIDMVSFDSRYSRTWQNYMTKHDLLPF